MRAMITIPILIFAVTSLGLTLNYTNAELSANNAFILTGSGFAVTEEAIKNTEIDLAIATGNKIGSNTDILVEDGFVTLNEQDFIVIDFSGQALRDDRYIRISGTAESTTGSETSIRIFGRLIENSADGSIYGFTGRLTHDGETHKIIYTTKLSGLKSIITPNISTEQQKSDVVIRILKGSSDRGIVSSYIDLAQTQDNSPTRANYFFPTNISIEPGSTVIFVNDDTVPHRVVSGTGLGSNNRASQGAVVICETPQKELRPGASYASTGCTFSFDGRIDSGIIEPGKSWVGTFTDAGFYRIIDPNYPWMNIVVYSFPDTGSEVIRRTGGK
ncbi:MAG TPA: hypothetical protein VLC72_03460 [Nitrosopumilaceae archaeon]|nr:hypothetical protein [Nitrosopumilaceae archaeon]